MLYLYTKHLRQLWYWNTLRGKLYNNDNEKVRKFTELYINVVKAAKIRVIDSTVVEYIKIIPGNVQENLYWYSQADTFNYHAGNI